MKKERQGLKDAKQWLKEHYVPLLFSVAMFASAIIISVKDIRI